MKSKLNNLARWTIILTLPVFIILSTLYIFFTSAFVRYEYSRPGFPTALNFSADSRYYNSVESMDFVLGQRTLAQFIGLGVYNEREISHMVDVQRVTRGALTTHAVVGIFLVLAILFLLSKKDTRLLAYGALQSGSILTLILVAMIGIFSVTAFDQFFVLFHAFLFTGDTWLFPPTDSLIQFYPIEFWEDTAYSIALFSIFGAIVVGGIAIWLKRRSTSRSVNSAVMPGR